MDARLPDRFFVIALKLDAPSRFRTTSELRGSVDELFLAVNGKARSTLFSHVKGILPLLRDYHKHGVVYDATAWVRAQQGKRKWVSWSLGVVDSRGSHAYPTIDAGAIPPAAPS